MASTQCLWILTSVPAAVPCLVLCVCVFVFLLWQSLCSSFVFSLLFLVVSVRKLVSCSGSCFVFTNTAFIFRELFVCLLVLPLDLTCCRVFNKLTFADLTWFFSPLYFWSSVRVDSPSHILLIHNTVQFINRKCEKYACKSFFLTTRYSIAEPQFVFFLSKQKKRRFFGKFHWITWQISCSRMTQHVQLHGKPYSCCKMCTNIYMRKRKIEIVIFLWCWDDMLRDNLSVIICFSNIIQ